MTDYHAPTKDMLFVINELASLADVNRLPGFEEASADVVEAVLEAAAQLANEVIAPTNRLGDTQGSHLEDGSVRVPAEFADAYRRSVENGWPSLVMDPEYGGQERQAGDS